MPKAFSEKEKDWIKEKLLKEGQKLFERYGLEKTTVDEIVRNVGISKGSFYLFYNSKEELFFDILEKIEREFKDKLFEKTTLLENPRKGLREFLLKGFEFLEKNPLFKYVTGGEIEYLMRKLPQDKISSHMNKDIGQIMNFIIKNQESGIFAKKNIKGIIAFLKLFPYIIIHKDEFESDEFEAMKNAIVEMIVNYLCDK
ncbi:MAG: TetR/AcrR family transcriptional regulator [Brevinematia bacterium]